MQPAPGPEDLEAATNSYLEILLTATDDDGVSTTVSRSILPKLVWLDFDTEPSGLDIALDETFVTTPKRVLSWENHELRVMAPDQGNYQFGAWSHGGCQQYTIQVPTNKNCILKYTAIFDDLGLVDEQRRLQVGASAIAKNESSCGANTSARLPPSDSPSLIPSDIPSKAPSDMP